MVAFSSQFSACRPNHPPRRSPLVAQVRYQSPHDLLPWADPYIASLFASEMEEEGNAGVDQAFRSTLITAGE